MYNLLIRIGPSYPLYFPIKTIFFNLYENCRANCDGKIHNYQIIIQIIEHVFSCKLKYVRDVQN